MKKWFYFSVLLLMISGCASTDRMLRMSGGVLDEYSAPRKSRIRSEKYQSVSRQLASPERSNKIEVAGMDDTLVNIWPFFFRSNAYWTALWPLIDCDPYGFAFRPFYNHEGDDYSMLFPLSAWNTAAGHGWVTLFGWNKNGFGMVPLTWQWKEKHSGGAYYTPLFFCAYDNEPFQYTVTETKDSHRGFTVYDKWDREEITRFILLTWYSREVRKDKGQWEWLFRMWYPSLHAKSEWNYRFNGKVPFPASELEYERYAAGIFDTLPEKTERTYGVFPFWFGSFDDNGAYSNRFMLLAGNRKKGNYSGWDILGDVIAGYDHEKRTYSQNRWAVPEKSTFTSWILLSHFAKEMRYRTGGNWEIFNKLHSLDNSGKTFTQVKPEILDTLKKLDPALTLPETVVDSWTYGLFLSDLAKKYEFPTDPEYYGRILPLYWYADRRESSYGVIPPLLTWWDSNKDQKTRNFTSLPLLTWVKRSPREDKTIVMTPLVYYAKEKHRKRSEFRIYPADQSVTGDGDCVELRDRYAGCGLFYRGRFGFNVAKKGVDAKTADALRLSLRELYKTRESIDRETAAIAKERSLADRWQPANEIERLKRLIRYEELKERQLELDKKTAEYRKGVDKAVGRAAKLGFSVDRAAFEKKADSEKALTEFMEKFTELRFYEDIGSGLFFNKKKYYNGDYNWHLLHILAGGERTEERESQHILHLLYRYRKEGKRSETIIFPFISSVQDGDDSRVSFLWRLFSLSKRNGKTGGYILFIPFGEN